MLTFGLALGLGPEVGRSGLGMMERLFEACAAFWKAAPWEYIDSDEPIRVELSNGRRRKAEASVLGAGGEEFGLALYDEPDSIRRVAAAVSAGRMEAAARVASTAVTFDAEPAWAAKAFEDAFGLPRLPVPLRVRNGKASPAKVEELHALVAVLEAVTTLVDSDDLDPSEATVEVGGVELTARASLPEDVGGNEEDLGEPMLVPDPLARLAGASARRATRPAHAEAGASTRSATSPRTRSGSGRRAARARKRRRLARRRAG